MSSSKTMQPKEKTSAEGPYSLPTITSGERYCLVWMLLVKCLSTQHAFPKSTIRMRYLSIPTGKLDEERGEGTVACSSSKVGGCDDGDGDAVEAEGCGGGGDCNRGECCERSCVT